jgi:uncharacterized SAM-binding protein YcdF (DUF218 family)
LRFFEGGVIFTTIYFYIKKFFGYFLLPPGMFVILFLLGGLLCRRERKVSFLLFFSGFLLYFLSIDPVNYLLRKLWFLPGEECRVDQGELIIVLSGGMEDSQTLSDTTISRLHYAVSLYRKTPLPILLSGGPVFSYPSEATFMVRFLKEEGIPEELLFAETKSMDTRTNAHFCKKWMEEHNKKSALLVTSPYHLRRALSFFRKEGVSVIPCSGEGSGKKVYSFLSFLPRAEVFSSSVAIVREIFGMVELFLAP